MVLDSNSSATRAAVADRDVLVKGRGTLNGGLIDALVFPDGISGTVACNRTLLTATSADTLVTLHNVVLNQRVGGPAVHRQAAEPATDTKSTTMGNRSIARLVNRSAGKDYWYSIQGASRIPPNSYNEILLGIPVDRELIGPRRVIDCSTGRVVLIVVCVGATIESLVKATRERVIWSHEIVEGATFLDSLCDYLSRGSKGRSDSGKRYDETREGNHDSGDDS